MRALAIASATNVSVKLRILLRPFAEGAAVGPPAGFASRRFSGGRSDSRLAQAHRG